MDTPNIEILWLNTIYDGKYFVNTVTLKNNWNYKTSLCFLNYVWVSKLIGLTGIPVEWSQLNRRCWDAYSSKARSLICLWDVHVSNSICKFSKCLLSFWDCIWTLTDMFCTIQSKYIGKHKYTKLTCLVSRVSKYTSASNAVRCNMLWINRIHIDLKILNYNQSLQNPFMSLNMKHSFYI